MKIFNSIGHFFAWVIGKAVPAVQAAEASPVAQAISSLLGSKAPAVEAGIQAIAGDVLKAFGAAGAAVGAGGLNVEFDQATIAAIEELYHDLAGLFGKTPPTPAAAGNK